MRVSFAKAQLLDSLVAPCPREGHCCGQVGSLPHPVYDGGSPARLPEGQPPRESLPAVLPCPLLPREPPAGPSLLAGEADPVLLTGDWRSRCPASPSSALGSCAAGLMLGIDRGSQSLAHIHAGSSTRTRKERTAFLQGHGFPPASPFSSYTARQARGPTVPPPAGVTAGSQGAEVPQGPGTTGQGCPGHRERCSASQREAPSLGKPSPSGGGCCPRRGSGASAALCAQGAHSAPDAFSNLARLVRLRQRGRGVSALTLARPRSRPRCEGAPRR